MKKTFLAALLCGLFFAPALKAQDKPEDFTFPAEFDRHESVWISWPSVVEYNPNRPLGPVLMSVVRELAPHVRVDLIARNQKELKAIKRLLKQNGVPDGHVRYHVSANTEMWLRDMGPIFVRDGKGNVKVVDFNFNSWGYEGRGATANYSRRLEALDRFVAGRLRLPMTKTWIVGEGGDREFNGRGTMMVVEEVELNRNPNRSKAELEAEYKRVLGQKQVVWLKRGLVEDQHPFKGTLPGGIFTSGTPGGHIDEFARFVSDDTILLAEVTPAERDADPIAKIDFERLEENRRIIEAARDRDGRPFNIVRMPVPVPIIDEVEADDFYAGLKYDDGTVVKKGQKIRMMLAASYLNYLVTNGVVLMQAYWRPGRSDTVKQKDDQAARILQGVFPDRKIVRIEAENVNSGGGGIHCVTQQQPARR